MRSNPTLLQQPHQHPRGAGDVPVARLPLADGAARLDAQHTRQTLGAKAQSMANGFEFGGGHLRQLVAEDWRTIFVTDAGQMVAEFDHFAAVADLGADSKVSVAKFEDVSARAVKCEGPRQHVVGVAPAIITFDVELAGLGHRAFVGDHVEQSVDSWIEREVGHLSSPSLGGHHWPVDNSNIGPMGLGVKGLKCGYHTYLEE